MLTTAATTTFVNLLELEPMAKAVLPKMVFDYYAGGSDSMSSVRGNTEAFKRIQLVPRILRNVSNVNTSPQPLWGMDLSFPVMVAPMAMHGMANPQRELATSRAAARAGIPFVFSTMATASLEELAPTGPNLVFQLYVIRNRNIVRGWVQQAEQLGFKALVVTVDAPRLAKREDDERNKFKLPAGLQLKNLAPLQALKAAKADKAATATQSSKPEGEGSGLFALFAQEVDDTLTWEFIPWLRTITKLPIIIKGLLSPEDAKIAMEHGVDGIVVSNHGGRQLDYSPSAIDMLPSVLKEVRGRVPVLVDGGVRRGTDVLKALALGASAVLLGRPVLYGLAVGGEEGVLRVLQHLKADFELAMALAGCSNISEISPALLRLQSRL